MVGDGEPFIRYKQLLLARQKSRPSLESLGFFGKLPNDSTRWGIDLRCPSPRIQSSPVIPPPAPSLSVNRHCAYACPCTTDLLIVTTYSSPKRNDTQFRASLIRSRRLIRELFAAWWVHASFAMLIAWRRMRSILCKLFASSRHRVLYLSRDYAQFCSDDIKRVALTSTT